MVEIYRFDRKKAKFTDRKSDWAAWVKYVFRVEKTLLGISNRVSVFHMPRMVEIYRFDPKKGKVLEPEVGLGNLGQIRLPAKNDPFRYFNSSFGRLYA